MHAWSNIDQLVFYIAVRHKPPQVYKHGLKFSHFTSVGASVDSLLVERHVEGNDSGKVGHIVMQLHVHTRLLVKLCQVSELDHVIFARCKAHTPKKAEISKTWQNNVTLYFNTNVVLKCQNFKYRLHVAL